ncbi:protease SohB [Alteromonas oceanisediminis]|uniref:protease SohB n=1 Tax=Alteromonas oceanisediminis TaxID=2836180 RepID=UPI001BDB2773|nr:protease SohB [Alteromonas oceanisediminis]MBT0586446.1 protease SohB [Alteromonas oceanisediminis]
MEFLYEYGVFLAKAITIVVAIAVVVAVIAGQAMRQKPSNGQLEITSISEKLDGIVDYAKGVLLSKDELKALDKADKAKAKADKKQAKKSSKDSEKNASRLFVIDFDGSMDAHEVDQLREEVTAVLSIASEQDEVLVNVESGGGVVHGYGLAASQLQRIKDAKLPLTIAVDKVAASGGYMMACVADKIIASPFAIIGSIGVIAQLPNFNKVLKKHDVEFEQHTAGAFKRTLTMFGENNEAGREKFREELEDVHGMFKRFVSDHRPDLDIDKVATGEYWYGNKALDLGLIDSIQTSDDFIMAKNKQKKVYAIKYAAKKSMAEKLGLGFASATERGLMRVWERSQSLFR